MSRPGVSRYKFHIGNWLQTVSLAGDAMSVDEIRSALEPSRQANFPFAAAKRVHPSRFRAHPVLHLYIVFQQ
jgi:hypothetical protein